MGLQMIFLATFSQFALAPVLWSFWITLFGITHPVHTVLGETATTAMIVLFFKSEFLNITMAMVAASSKPPDEVGPDNPPVFHTWSARRLQSYIRDDRNTVLLGQSRTRRDEKGIAASVISRHLTAQLRTHCLINHSSGHVCQI
jgi:hypothetical protein